MKAMSAARTVSGFRRSTNPTSPVTRIPMGCSRRYDHSSATIRASAYPWLSPVGLMGTSLPSMSS
jgi:hypothetical protein